MLVAEAMTGHPVTMPPSASAAKAAVAMRDHDIGDVLVVERDGTLRGIVTDRDIALRVAAEGRKATRLADICSTNLWCARPMDGLEDAARTMREHAVRRLPVVDGENKPIGVISIGDLAHYLDPHSAVAQISTAHPTTERDAEPVS